MAAAGVAAAVLTAAVRAARRALVAAPGAAAGRRRRGRSLARGGETQPGEAGDGEDDGVQDHGLHGKVFLGRRVRNATRRFLWSVQKRGGRRRELPGRRGRTGAVPSVSLKEPRRGFDRHGDDGHRLRRGDNGEGGEKMESQNRNFRQDIAVPGRDELGRRRRLHDALLRRQRGRVFVTRLRRAALVRL